MSQKNFDLFDLDCYIIASARFEDKVVYIVKNNTYETQYYFIVSSIEESLDSLSDAISASFRYDDFFFVDSTFILCEQLSKEEAKKRFKEEFNNELY